MIEYRKIYVHIVANRKLMFCGRSWVVFNPRDKLRMGVFGGLIETGLE